MIEHNITQSEKNSYDGDLKAAWGNAKHELTGLGANLVAAACFAFAVVGDAAQGHPVDAAITLVAAGINVWVAAKRAEDFHRSFEKVSAPAP